MRARDVRALCILLGLFAAIAMPATLLAASPGTQRNLYAVNQSTSNWGSISVYDIEAVHRLMKTITMVPEIADVR
jgi:hypothetical protein